MNQFHSESARETPIVRRCDVVICGGGPAGIAAAVAAARAGAQTTLLEMQGCLGGVWTSGALTWIIDARNKAGVMREILGRLDARDAHAPRNAGDAYDCETMKLVLEEMCAQAGIEVQYHTRVVAAARDGAARLSVVVTESKSGRQAWAAPLFIDATGDGDLAAQAGCGFDMGRPGTPGEAGVGEVQPMTLTALVAGIQAAEVEAFIGGMAHAPKVRLAAEMTRAGVAPSYGLPVLFRVRDDLFALASTHIYGVKADDAAAITRATIAARAEVFEQVAALRELGAPWANLRIVATGNQIGVREGRRVRGHYCVSQADLLNGARHPDAVCRVTFGVDVHSTNRASGTTVSTENKRKTMPYDIPLRALIARDVDGLLLAGRCISGDFIAHSSYRVTGNAVALGEAAGAVAALCAREKLLPQNVELAKLRAVLPLQEN